MKVMSYNIRHGWGINKFFGLKDIFHTIKKYQPDIIGLNEVDKYHPRSLFVHQAKVLAERLNYYYSFIPNIKIGPVGYGNAILSKFPIIEEKNHLLISKGEQRGCLAVTIDLFDNIWCQKIKFFCTHLGLDVQERKKQISQIVDLIKKTVEPIILLGDFNCHKDELSVIKEIMTDALQSEKEDHPSNTYPSIKSTQRLDYIFHNLGFMTLNFRTINSEASDHLPILATLELVKGSKNV